MQTISNKLVEFAPMLKDYYSLTVTEDGQMTTLPILLRGYIPTLDKLPMFLLRLGTEVK